MSILELKLLNVTTRNLWNSVMIPLMIPVTANEPRIYLLNSHAVVWTPANSDKVI